MKLSWDEEKRSQTLASRGLDFARCEEVFSGPTLEYEDDRKDYGEKRLVAIGFLDANLVVVVFTEREDTTRIISMRPATKQEREIYEKEVLRP